MKYCNRCKLGIDITNERYVIVEDKDGKKELKKLYFHKDCWHEIMTGKNKNKQLQDQALDFLNFAKNKIGYEEKIII